MTDQRNHASGSGSQVALLNWERNRHYASTSTSLPFPPTSTSSLAEENIRLRKHVELQESIAESYETELVACREAMKILGSEMKKAAKAADTWRSEASRLEKEQGKEEVERLKELCEELEDALYTTQEEMRMIESKGGRGATGLPTPTEEDDNFVSFANTNHGNFNEDVTDASDRIGASSPEQHHHLDATRSLVPGDRSASSILPIPSPSSPTHTIPTFEGSRTADGPTIRPESELPSRSFETMLTEGEHSMQRREDEEWEALHVRMATLQTERDALERERDELLGEKDQV